MPKTVAKADLDQAERDYTGWCSTCQDFTTECVEPDAEGYECEVCGEWTVCGAMHAVVSGLIDFAG